MLTFLSVTVPRVAFAIVIVKDVLQRGQPSFLPVAILGEGSAPVLTTKLWWDERIDL